ncbi:PTS transporter subunit EIIC [Floccifex sp.]|uniref:PTS transporter subunit EIIC n=1 Tax=Floccifex sp. TaxID=2815810 RepID=UPI002A74A9C4|nr:PTS transporter subunit EIIC [Floccifex sp.]MDD7282061.1 PTS transporter subunit EIIC [Erysipelotrichaceae bacterium]MDY2958758.1 PTS transporter subunit EIIC [Floccifex sp.]
MDKNQQIATEVLQAVGGKENVTFVTHCITRLRFNLKDESVIDDEKIKGIKGVIGVTRSSGQYHVIIGQNVTKVYEHLCKIGGFAQESSINEDLDTEKKKWTPKSVGKAIMDTLSGSITPLIPIMMGAAMFKMIVAVFGDMLGWIEAGSNIYTLCTFVGDAGFYFMPIFLGYTAGKKMGASPFIGMLLGAILIHPTFISLVGSNFDVFGIPVTPSNYTSTVLPIILTVFILKWVEKGLKKIIPDILSTVFVPFLSLVIMLPIMFGVCAPIGGWIGNALCSGLLALGNIPVIGILVIALIGGLWEFLVMTGMHQVFIANMLILFAENGFDAVVSPGATMASVAVSGMLIGAFLKIKDKDEKALTLSYLISAFIGGITEPGLYGTGLKFKRPFIGLFAGGFAGALYCAIMGVASYAMVPVASFVALSGFAGGPAGNFTQGVIGGVIAIIVAAVVTYFFGFSKDEEVIKK